MAGQVLSLADFWASIDKAWSANNANNARARLLSSDTAEREAAFEELDEHLDTMIAALTEILNTYTSNQLKLWDSHCERVLYDIDREDVHNVTDGSDDGFLYARGFIVACGREYYDAVNKSPADYGILDAECEVMCYLAAHVHEERFGEWTDRSHISRESFSNPDGWKKQE